MATFEFYATFDEAWEMLRDIFARGDIRAVQMNTYFPAPEAAPIYAEASLQLRSLLMHHSSPAVMLYGSFSPEAPYFQLLGRADWPTSYYVFPIIGGPGIEFHFSRVTKGGGLSPGDIQMHSSYRSTATGQYQRRSEEVVAAYYDIQKRLKRHLNRHSFVDVTRVWIGPDALAKVESGEAWLAHGRSKHYTAGQWREGLPQEVLRPDPR